MSWSILKQNHLVVVWKRTLCEPESWLEGHIHKLYRLTEQLTIAGLELAVAMERIRRIGGYLGGKISNTVGSGLS